MKIIVLTNKEYKMLNNMIYDAYNNGALLLFVNENEKKIINKALEKWDYPLNFKCLKNNKKKI